MQKLMHRVVFPMELKLCNTTDDNPDSDDVYNLFAVVVHSGSSLNHGKMSVILILCICREHTK